MSKKTMRCYCCCWPKKERYEIENNNAVKSTTYKDLTKEEPARTTNNSTIEELKHKLGAKDNIIETEEEETATITTGGTMIPEGGQRAPALHHHHHHQGSPPLLNDDGLIIPRKPPNPIKENSERQNLHRELLFNQKIGKNVLNQKSELQKALEKQKEHLAKKQMETHEAEKKPELEKVIADRAKRLQANETKSEVDDKVISKEFLEARMKLKKSQ